MKNKPLAMVMFLIIFIGSTAITVPLGVHATPHDPAFTILYGDVYLSGGFQAGHFDEVWDLTASDMVISFIYDANGLVDDSGCHAWAQLGIRAVGYGDFNPTWMNEGAGVWLATDYDWTVNTFDPDPPGSPTLDMDDKLILQKGGGWGEGSYNLPSTPPVPGDNYGIWFDRDGVDPWQATYWGAIDGATYNTNGVYHVEIRLHATSDTTGEAYMTVNGVKQGFYVGGWKNAQPEIYPAGMTFTGDMKHMQLFYGLYGYGAIHNVAFKEINVTIELPPPSEVWVDDDWTGLPIGYRVEPGKFIGYNAFAKIQDAINAVATGTTIYVYEGIYNENLVINKSLTIHGVNKETTIIMGLGYTDTIKITASNVTISGFTIRQEKKLFGVNTDTSVRQSNIVLFDNIFDQCSYNYLYSVDYAKVYDNEFRGGGLAIWRSMGGEIYNNTISTFGVGVALYWVNETTVKGNRIFAPSKDVYSDIGIHAQSCERLVIWGNEIFNFTAGPKQYYTYGTKGAAINVYVSKAIDVQCNDLHDNSIGVLVQRLNLTTEPREVNIHYNNLEGNTEFGVLNCYTWIGKDKTYTPTNESFIVDARYNWWGHETGPYHGTSWNYMGSPYGPHDGLGDNVSDYVLYDHWLKTPFTPPPIHDVAIIGVVPSSLRVAVGATIQVNVEAKNEGNTYETFDVSLYYDSNLIGVQTITDLAPGATQMLTFTWDTTGITLYGDYIIKAEASAVLGEIDLADNIKTVLVRVGEKPKLVIDPPTYTAKLLSETFTINVTMNGLGEYWRVTGLEFRVAYNSTLLRVVNVTEGPFMKDPRWNRYGTFFIYFIERETVLPNGTIIPPHVLIGILLLPNATGHWEAFPHGDGVLATITFEVIYQDRGYDKRLGYIIPPITSSFKLFKSRMIDDDGLLIPHDAEGWQYTINPTNIADVNYDGYVGVDDIFVIAQAFGEEPSRPRWNPDFDLNKDNYIGIDDVWIAASNFGWEPDP